MTLPRLTIATPCTLDWESMTGDGRVRRCPSCDKNVYNVESLSRRELVRLVESGEGRRPCLRLYRRPDGTVVTRGCLAPLRRAAGWLRLKVAVLAGFLLAGWTDVALAHARRLGPPSRPGTAATGRETLAAATPSKHRPKPKRDPPPPPPPQPKPRPNDYEMGLPM